MGMNKRKATKAHTKCTYWESTHNKINKQTWTCKLSSTQENAHTQPSLCVHGFFGYSPAPHNKLHEIFSEFFNMCSFPFRTCRSAKKNVGGGSDGEMGRRGGGRSQWGQGRESIRREPTSEPENDWEKQRERREREREKTQLTVFQATPLSNSPGSACVPLASWQHASQSHAWLLSQSGVSLQLCILDFIFTMATQACSWPWMWPV